MLTHLCFILQIELLQKWRHPQEWLHPLAFFLMLIVLFPLTLTTDPHFLSLFFPGYLWTSALLASLLSIQTVFSSEMEEGHIEQLFFSEVPLPIILIIKLVIHWLITQLPLIMLTPLLGWLFHLSTTSIAVLCISLLLGTPILTFTSSAGVALTIGLKQQGVLLSLLILPLLIPILLFGINIVKQSEQGISILGSCAALAGIALLAVTLLPFAMTAALRFSLDE